MNSPINPPPSLLPDDPKKAYQKGFEDARRLFHSSSDPMLEAMQQKVKEVRQELLRQGRVKPANDKEREFLKQKRRYNGKRTTL